LQTRRARAPEELLPFLVHLLSLRDPHAVVHSNNVKALASAMARELGLPGAQVRKIEFAAAIHDIGKMAMNDFLMSKPGTFTQAEHMMIQQHAMLGAGILEKLELDPDIIEIVLQHHENYDGSGYPQGLRGEQICLGARIIRIVDTYDALTTHRGYRLPQSSRKALAIMEAAGKDFDPHLLDLFRKMRSRTKR
jgi:putative nucleotidyltransferase with HDIG domain